MDNRWRTTIAAATVLALPVLAGCGAGTASAPTSTTAPSSAAAPAPDPSTSPTASSSPSPTADPAEAEKDVQDATEKFAKTVLTIGYPDKDLDDYLDRVEPLMTKEGFAGVKNDKTLKKQEKSLKTLYSQHARVVPELDGDPKVSGLTNDSARAKLTYRLKTQQQRGEDWKTLDTSSKESGTIALALEDGKWLVSDAN